VGGVPVTVRRYDADYWEGGGYLELRNGLGRRSAVYLRGRVRTRLFDNVSTSDHTAYSARLGFQSQLLTRLQLDVSAGYGYIVFQHQGDVPRFLGSLDLRYRASGGWNLELGAHNKFTSDLTGNEFEDTTGRLSVEKFLGRRTSVRLTGFLSYLQGDTYDPATNVFGGAEFRVLHQLSRDLQVGVAYRYWNNRGAYALDDFEQNRLMFSLVYRY
jgi:hypothetical protein